MAKKIIKDGHSYPMRGTKLSRPRPVDVHVGNRLRMQRKLLGMTQTELAHGLGLTFQQIQKYEKGTNRIGASRLYDISRIFEVPVSFFFEMMPDSVSADSGKRQIPNMKRFSKLGITDKMLFSGETFKLLAAYYSIKDPEIRKQFFIFMNTFSNK